MYENKYESRNSINFIKLVDSIFKIIHTFQILQILLNINLYKCLTFLLQIIISHSLIK